MTSVKEKIKIVPTKKKIKKLLAIKQEFKKLAAQGCQEAINILNFRCPDSSDENLWQFYDN